MKTCPKCQTTKPLSKFYRCRTTKDGLQVWCKPCNSAANERVRRKQGGLSAEDRLALRRKMAIAPTRICIRCRISKTRAEFHRNRLALGGTTNICRACRPAYEAGVRERIRRDPEWARRRRLSQNAGQKKWRKTAKGRLHNAAVKMVHLALHFGMLHRQPCEVCGATKVQAHHTDYTKPLEVHWLCHAHHRAAHSRSSPGK